MNDSTTLNKPAVQFGILILLTFIVYYSTIFAPETIIDDEQAFSALSEVDRIDIKAIFNPGHVYYRPLLYLSQVVDKLFWDLDPSFMHLENVIIHLLNVLILYVLIRSVCQRYGYSSQEIPFLAAGYFAIHPVNIEAVAWISGRTDPLMSLFLLLAVASSLTAVSRNSFVLAIISPCLVLLASLVKETAIVFIPLLVVIQNFFATDRIFRRRMLIITSTIGFLMPVAYIWFRSSGMKSLDQGLQLLMQGWHYGMYDTVRVFFKVVGFYVRKLIFPFPLNFAIKKVSDWHVLAGIVSIVVCMWLLCRRRDLPSFLTSCSLYMLGPAILVAFIGIAWTPVAERYLYFPSILWCSAIAMYIVMLADNLNAKRHLISLSVCSMIPLAILSSDRARLWGDQAAFYEDTVRKSPEFNSLRNEYGLALVRQGKYSSAHAEFSTGMKNDPEARNTFYYVNHALLLSKQGKHLEAQSVLRGVIAKRPDNSLEAHKALIRVDSELLHRQQGVSRNAKVLAEEIFSSWQYVFNKSGDPFALYQAGQMAMYLEQNERAAYFFAKAARLAPETAYYREPARKLAEKLNSRIERE